MREIDVRKIKKIVSGLCIEANIDLRKDVLSALKKAGRLEQNKKARRMLDILIENAGIARRERIAICQDTGMACVYLEAGQDAHIVGGGLEKAVNDGVRLGYKKGYLRNSIVDPLSRKNTSDNAPAVIHMKVVQGHKVKITVVPKGFGCENKNQLRMFKPTAGLDEIKKFVIDVVREAGADACPPFVIGIGLGGTFEKAAELSKEALLKKIPNSKFQIPNKFQISNSKPKILIAKLEKDLLAEINKLGIGPAGVGGRTTALAVNILTYPTHIAGLPVAVSIGCHAMRSAAEII